MEQGKVTIMLGFLNDPKARNVISALVAIAVATQAYAADHTIADKVATWIIDIGVIFGTWASSARVNK